MSGYISLLIRTATLAVCVLGIEGTAFAQARPAPPSTGAEFYRAACASCHGVDGRGAPREAVAFANRLPDFTDCRFAPREPDMNWLAIIHGGGPARAFSQIMPSFRDALTTDQIRLALDYVRSFCTNLAWPRGNLNFPKALVTEKAFPEDEMLFTTTVATEGTGSVTEKVVYERRFGARTQMEFGVPLQAEQRPPGEADAGQWARGVGDVTVALKRVLVHSLKRQQIISVSAEVVLPTGSESQGLGGGTAAIEPFVTYGQMLPADVFIQAQAGVGLPFDTALAKDALWRVAIGKSFWQKRWGRMWSPMIEVLGGRELVNGEPALWDVVPEMQVTLSTRQHIRANVGMRLPVNEASTRSRQFLAYLLWDWYDGPFFGGW